MINWLLLINTIGIRNWQGCTLAVVVLLIIIANIYQMIKNIDKKGDGNNDNFAI